MNHRQKKTNDAQVEVVKTALRQIGEEWLQKQKERVGGWVINFILCFVAYLIYKLVVVRNPEMFFDFAKHHIDFPVPSVSTGN